MAVGFGYAGQYRPINHTCGRGEGTRCAALSFRLTFAPPLERLFDDTTRTDRLRNIIWTAVAAIVLYDIFLINDWLALHDRFKEMLVARLFIFTPFMIILMVAAYRWKSASTAEWSAAAGAVLAVFLPMTVLVFSNSSHRLSYQYGSLLVMMFATVIQRVRFRPAVTALVVIMVIQLGATYFSRAFDTETYVAIVTFFGAAAILQLVALMIMERADRRGFLLALRGRLLHDQLLLSARTDALTGLYNRRHLADVCQEIWAQTNPQRISAILIDIDNFKLFNDSYGHLEGDDCLRTLSDCIQRAVAGTAALAFRFGGEEMLILLPATRLREARQTAEQIQREIAAAAIPHPALGQDVIVSASLGLADVTAPKSTSAALLAAADAALYTAKRTGRNKIWPPSDAAVRQDLPLEIVSA